MLNCYDYPINSNSNTIVVQMTKYKVYSTKRARYIQNCDIFITS
jgi:hypothetical protein